jgi:hypothetical protein
MAKVFWSNPVNGSFQDATKWSGGDVPGASADAVLNAGGSYKVTSDTSATVAGVQTTAGAQLIVGPNTVFTATRGTDGGVNGGVITVDNSTFATAGTIDQTGALNLFGGTLQITAAATLTGSGAVNLASGSAGHAQTIVGATASTRLTNQSTIQGAGYVGDGSLTMLNTSSGAIDANAQGLLLIQMGPSASMAGNLQNEGKIAELNIGVLTIQNTNINNTGGVISAQGSGLLTMNSSKCTGGYISTYAGAQLAFNGATATGVQLTIASGGKFAVNGVGNAIYEGKLTGAALANSGATTINGALMVDGAIENYGTITVNASGNTLLADSTTLEGGGSVILAGGSVSSTGSKRQNLINVDNTISGQGQLGAGLLSLENASKGVISANVAGQLMIDLGPSPSNKGNLLNAGKIQAVGVGSLTIQNAIISPDAGIEGTIGAMGSGPLTLTNVSCRGDEIMSATGAQVVFNNATTTGPVTIAAGGQLTIEGNLDGLLYWLTNDGLVEINSTLVMSGHAKNNGQINLVNGAPAVLDIGAGGLVLVGDGAVALGDGTITTQGAVETLYNYKNTISGDGTIGTGADGLKLVNHGLIDGASLTINTGAATIFNGGTIEETTANKTTTVKSAVQNEGVLSVMAGTLAVNGAVSGTGSVKIGGGVAEFEAGVSQIVAFTGKTGQLQLGDSQAFTGVISGFSKTGGTSLDLRDINYIAGVTQATFANGVLTVTDTDHTATIKLDGDYSNSTFTVSSDGDGGTLVVDPTVRPASAVGASPGWLAAAMAAMGARPAGAHDARPLDRRQEPTMLATPPRAMFA